MWKRRKWRFVCVLTGKLSDYKEYGGRMIFIDKDKYRDSSGIYSITNTVNGKSM